MFIINKEHVIAILNEIKRILGTNFEYTCPYGNNIEVIGCRDDTRFWIRLIRLNEASIAVDFSNVQLDDSLRGFGIFRKIALATLELQCVEYIQVSSVLTTEMHKACQSLRMRYEISIQGYRISKEEWYKRSRPDFIDDLDGDSVSKALKYPNNILIRSGYSILDACCNPAVFESIYIDSAVLKLDNNSIKDKIDSILQGDRQLSSRARSVLNILKMPDIIGRVRIVKDSSYFNLVIKFREQFQNTEVYFLSHGNKCRYLRNILTEANKPEEFSRLIKEYLNKASALYVSFGI